MSPNPRIAPRLSVGETGRFVDLLCLACEDPHIHDTLLRLLSQDPLRRQTLLHNWVGDLLINEAPQAFIQAIACLMDDEVAERARAVIQPRLQAQRPWRDAPQR